MNINKFKNEDCLYSSIIKTNCYRGTHTTFLAWIVIINIENDNYLKNDVDSTRLFDNGPYMCKFE